MRKLVWERRLGPQDGSAHLAHIGELQSPSHRCKVDTHGIRNWGIGFCKVENLYPDPDLTVSHPLPTWVYPTRDNPTFDARWLRHLFRSFVRHSKEAREVDALVLYSFM